MKYYKREKRNQPYEGETIQDTRGVGVPGHTDNPRRHSHGVVRVRNNYGV